MYQLISSLVLEMCWIFLAPLFWPYDAVSVTKNRRNWGNNGAGAAPVPYGLDFEEGQEEAVSTRWRETKWEIRSGSPCRGGNSQSMSIRKHLRHSFEYLLERFVQSMLNRLAHLRHDESRDPDAAMRQALGSTIHDSFLGFTEAGGRSGADFDAVLCFASFFVGQF